MTRVLTRAPIARLVRTPRGWLPILGWAVLAVVVALVMRARSAPTGADHVMRGAFGVFVVPLLSYGIASAVLGGAGLRHSIRGVVALGAEPRRAALASALVTVAACAAACGLLGAVVCGLAHGSHDPPLAFDLFASLWVGALGGAAYGAFFSAGSAVGKGWLRGVFLAFDWVVGAGAGVGALLTPRGHLMSLLGGARVAELPQRASCLALVILVAVYLALTVALTKRT